MGRCPMTDTGWPGAIPPADRLLDRAAPDRAPHMRSLLHALAALGCTVTAPDGVRDTYVNINRPPHAPGRARLASLHAQTGRVEFQRNAWDVVSDHGLVALFNHVPKGNKASIPMTGQETVSAALTVGKAILAGRSR